MNQRKVVARGQWLYAETTPMSVFIIRTGYDFWYELSRADNTLEQNETPSLNHAGHAYYISFRGLNDDGSFWPDSDTYLSLQEAQTGAAAKLPSAITWLFPVST